MPVVVEDNVGDGSMVAGKSYANMADVDVASAVPTDIQPDMISVELNLTADNAVVAAAVAVADDYHTVSSCASCSSHLGTSETDQNWRSAELTVDFRSGNAGIVVDVAFHRVRHV